MGRKKIKIMKEREYKVLIVWSDCDFTKKYEEILGVLENV